MDFLGINEQVLQKGQKTQFHDKLTVEWWSKKNSRTIKFCNLNEFSQGD